mmetsp:Transcript_12209/g.29413  ORF Transcript_12209/g.29413 Transcript_12209/m.29413 type:complete len:274 (-) Transcript_12209:72-893(-)
MSVEPHHDPSFLGIPAALGGGPRIGKDEEGDTKKTTKVTAGEASTTKTSATTTAKDKLWDTDTVTQIDCNVDDCPGEQLAFVVELLLSNRPSSPGTSVVPVANSSCFSFGQVVVDAWITPIVGKKGRPAHILSVLCLCGEENRSSYDNIKSNKDGDKEGEDGGNNSNFDNDTNNNEDPIDAVLELIFRHTTTLGIRIHRGIERVILRREIKDVPVTTETDGDGTEAKIRVKIGKFTTGEVVNMKAEYDDCRAVSLKTGIPIKSLAEDAVRTAR